MTKHNGTILQTEQDVKVVGRLAALTSAVRTMADGTPALSVKVEIKPDKRTRVRGEFYVPKFKKDGSIRKDFTGLEAVTQGARTIADNGEENADFVSMVAEIAPNDYVSKTTNRLVQGIILKGRFLNLAKDYEDEGATITFEGYIKSIKEEEPGLRVTVYGLDYRGDLVPFRFYVPEELKEDFEDTYREGETASFYLDIKTVTQVSKSDGGIGVQRTTGRDRIDYILVGATKPATGDNEIPEDVIEKAYRKRVEYLKRLEKQGPRGARSKKAESDDEYDF